MRRTWIVLGLVSLLAAAQGIWAEPREVRIPLEKGKIDLGRLSSALIDVGLADVHIPARVSFSGARINVRSWEGSLFVQAMNHALGDGCRLSVTKDALVLHIDSAKLPRDVNSAKKAIRDFTAEAAPDATARQARRYGLAMPPVVDARRPLVVLLHGLDCGGGYEMPMGEMLREDGFQVAYFTYPNDQPIEESAALLGRRLAAVRETFPGMQVDIVAHSMGGLVARAYVEGPEYAGGVDRLIMVGPPNHGAALAGFRMLLEAREQYYLWRYEPEWSASWCITDGLGEAGKELKPGSRFLKGLNSWPRREGVRYTIVAGCHNPIADVGAACLEKAVGWLPGEATRVWGIKQVYRGAEREAEKLRDRAGGSDGVVSVKSTKLEGVEDYTLVPEGHDQMFRTRGRAWEVIRDRLRG